MTKVTSKRPEAVEKAIASWWAGADNSPPQDRLQLEHRWSLIILGVGSLWPTLLYWEARERRFRA